MRAMAAARSSSQRWTAPPTASWSRWAIERSARHVSRSAASISLAARRPPRRADLGGPFVLPALDRTAHRLLVELGHRAQRAPRVPLGGEHLARRAEAVAQRRARVGLVRGLGEPRV